MKSCEIMANESVLCFGRPRDLFGLAKQVLRNDFAVDFPTVREYGEEFGAILS